MDVAGNLFVVSGAGHGIGREVVLELLRRGGRVAAVDCDGVALTNLKGKAKSSVDRLSLHSTDVSSERGVAALSDQVRREHGRVDGLINVAGIIHRFAPVLDLSTEEMAEVMAVNYWGTVYMTKAFLPQLLSRPAAALVNVISAGALMPSPGQAAYCASKSAVKLFTDALHAELRDTTVTVTEIIPGAVLTDIARNSGVEVGDLPTGDAATAAGCVMPEDAARQIANGLVRGAFRVLIGEDAVAADLR
ncbi:SDR family NAD(P)-dependent oxidoreductase [Mycobacterium sp. OAE908]|uniref:SDR family NAD(P)-dependent oxidoreductase n=1 Tax=Mycobacterium sp. OAE908 TaxID=2817899 RepID=UPI001AE773F4